VFYGNDVGELKS